MIYEKILRPILFRFTDPEKIHHTVTRGLGFVSRQKPLNKIVTGLLNNTDERLKTKIGKISLPNPVGLAAGFDKHVESPLAYPMLGFGSVELGSITFHEQEGNPKPRLWRIPKDKGLIVYSGLPNSGVVKTIERLSLLQKRAIPYGVSIAPSNHVDLPELGDDYLKTLDRVHPFADYITLNTSCPNVARHDHFTQITFIEELLNNTAEMIQKENINKDFFIKIGPDHSKQDLQRIVKSCIKNNFTGIVATNLIKIRSGLNFKSKLSETEHPGGISGGLLQAESDAIVQELYNECAGKLKIIGLGGIFDANDAYRKIKLGASAVQIMTGFIYGGPFIAKKINDGLVKLLEQDGYQNISEAVGKKS
jgi:dihydroorotate dehydrogenase